MFARSRSRSNSNSNESNTNESNSYESSSYSEKGISLARGPALLLGTVLAIAGLYALYKQHVFPPFSHFPNGHPANHKIFFGIFAANGWSGMLTAVAGMLLLIGAAQHLLAKTISLIVGVALGVAAVVGLISGNVFGMAASNIWTEIVWAGSAVILLLNTLMPRRTRTVTREPVPVQESGTQRYAGAQQPVREPAGATRTRDGDPAAETARTRAGTAEPSPTSNARTPSTTAPNPADDRGSEGGAADSSPVDSTSPLPSSQRPSGES